MGVAPQACASDCAAQLDDYVLAHILSFVPGAAERLRLAPVCKQVVHVLARL